VTYRRERGAVGLYLAASTGVAIWTVVVWAVHGFKPIAGLTWGLQKNTLGDLLVVGALAGEFFTFWSSGRSKYRTIAKYICVLGVLATGSRQAMIGLVVAGVIGIIRERRLSRLSGAKRISAAMVGFLVAVGITAYASLSREVANQNTSHITSLTIRTASYSNTLDIWRSSQIFGVGERYWYTARFPGTLQPPNAEIGLLATGGIVALIGFLLLVFGTARWLWRVPVAAGGTLVFAVFLAHIVEGQFDIFWVTGTGTVPWIFVGMGLAQLDGRHFHEEPEPVQMTSPIVTP
jgi:hypothetical protein